MPTASSLRAGVTNLYRRADLAPAVFIIAGISFLAHVLVGDNYGYFRDELYFLAMSQHPAFGYVDVPPLVPWIEQLPRLLTGNALWAIHVLSALVCAGTILLTGLMARLLGGTGWVQGLAALGSATALILMAAGSLYTYDVFDEFWWTLAAVILIVLLRDENPRRWLAFGLVAGLGLLTKEIILFVIFMALQGKSYFLAPAYPPLFAGGAMLFGQWRVRWRRWVAAYPVLLVVSAVLLAPAVMPVLPLTVYGQIYGKSSQEPGNIYGLPQALVDRFGWEEQVALIAQVYHSLPMDGQRVACIFTANYGEAAALVQFGGRYHLPPPISGHNAFYIWGSRGCSGQVIITINIPPQDAARGFSSVTLAASCRDYENHAPILILRQPKVPFIWTQVKHFD
jgi:Dolichyl-phosphate-mannose-protein mannosyltransferase